MAWRLRRLTAGINTTSGFTVLRPNLRYMHKTELTLYIYIMCVCVCVYIYLMHCVCLNFDGNCHLLTCLPVVVPYTKNMKHVFDLRSAWKTHAPTVQIE